MKRKVYSIGLDIGGSKIRAIWRDGRSIIRRGEVLTPRSKRLFIRLIKKFSSAPAVGIGVAGIVSGTKVVSSPNISYLEGFDFGELFSRLKVDNDARCFLRAEALKLKNKKVMAFTVGTGIGRAYSESGKIKKIKKFEYPERWEKKYQKIRDGGSDLKLAAFLAEKLKILLKHRRPDLVILGGGVTARKGFFIKLKKALGSFEVRRARLGKYAGAIGAALLFYE